MLLVDLLMIVGLATPSKTNAALQSTSFVLSVPRTFQKVEVAVVLDLSVSSLNFEVNKNQEKCITKSHAMHAYASSIQVHSCPRTVKAWADVMVKAWCDFGQKIIIFVQGPRTIFVPTLSSGAIVLPIEKMNQI